MQYPQGRILVFCKAPEPGKVKTRLQPALTPAQCSELHERLARHTLQTAAGSAVTHVELWCSGDLAHAFFNECRQRYGIELKQQQGRDLGECMAQALRTALRTSGFAIIIGTDCPALDGGYLQRAAALLAEGTRGNKARVVIGPATDGGYVLFGANSPQDSAFTDIEWGGGGVLRQTRARLQALGVAFNELEPLDDIDRPGDLIRLPRQLMDQ